MLTLTLQFEVGSEKGKIIQLRLIIPSSTKMIWYTINHVAQIIFGLNDLSYELELIDIFFKTLLIH